MRFLLCFIAIVGLAAPAMPIAAQTNNNEYTPLGSRIRHSQPFPNEPRATFQPRQLNDVQRARSRTMVDQLSRCIWDRSNEKGLDLLARTDFGFGSFEQIGIASEDVMKLYPIQTCLYRVASSANSSVMLRATPAAVRRWYLQAAYLAKYKDGPSWLQPGAVVAERSYPLSSNRPDVQAALDFADCVVTQDPQDADFLFRTAPDSDDERAAIRSLVPSMSPCLAEGQQLEIDPTALRWWIGESLWHAANNLVPAPAQSPESDQ